MSDIDYSKLSAAIANLQKEYKILQLAQSGELPNVSGLENHDWEQTAKNSVIKSFELCYEMLWKHLKKHLDDEIGGAVTPDHARGVFRYAHELDIIDEDLVEALFRYQKARNTTAHEYSKKESESVLDVVEDFIRDSTDLYVIMAVE